MCSKEPVERVDHRQEPGFTVHVGLLDFDDDILAAQAAQIALVLRVTVSHSASPRSFGGEIPKFATIVHLPASGVNSFCLRVCPNSARGVGMGTGSGRLRTVPVPISTPLAPPEKGDRHLEDSEPVPLFRLRFASGTDSQRIGRARGARAWPGTFTLEVFRENMAIGSRASARSASIRKDRSLMSEDHVGYVELNGRIVRFPEARCCFKDGQLDAEAESSKCRLMLYGIPFRDAKDVAGLSGKVFGPDSETVRSDPIAEGGIEIKGMWLCYTSLTVKCGTFDAGAGLLTVVFEGKAVDAETGFRATLDGMVRCRVVESLW